MSSSITTAVPSGLITTNWCVQNSLDYEGKPNTCGDSGEHPSDYGTICCAGDIVDTTSNTYQYGSSNNTIDLDTLVCCLVEGPQQQGGLQPIATDRSKCTQGSATPLASFAATNTANAARWEKTYTSAHKSVGASTTVLDDYVPLQSPRCLWVYTKTGIALRNVTVAAADITTPPAPTTDAMGSAITTRSVSSNSTTNSVTSTSSPMTDAATSGPSVTSASSISSATDAATTSALSASGAASVYGLDSTVLLLLLMLSFFGVVRS